MKRLFVAVKINPDPDFLHSFLELRHSLSHEKIRWVEERTIHITVKFLGETAESRIPEITETVRGLAESTEDFEFSLTGLGVFGSFYNPRVIWVGIHPYHCLAALLKKARAEFTLLGFADDRQNLVPHLTLGRIKYLHDKTGFRQILIRFGKISSEPLAAEKLILFESILRPSGPEYHLLSSFSFPGSWQRNDRPEG
ncbi:MAG: RNA 2',3'-cyclic phosphodiesterase [Bacteroidetes bacterium]|nr:MAG: RNA 2',3'-cyclic phosphodiesterase [Bacteroidota bacterium]